MLLMSAILRSTTMYFPWNVPSTTSRLPVDVQDLLRGGELHLVGGVYSGESYVLRDLDQHQRQHRHQRALLVRRSRVVDGGRGGRAHPLYIPAAVHDYPGPRLAGAPVELADHMSDNLG